MPSLVIFGDLLRVIITANNDASRRSINRLGFVKKVKKKSEVKYTLVQAERPIGGVEVQLYSFMTIAIEGGEVSASHPDRLLPPGKTRYPLYRIQPEYFDRIFITVSFCCA